MSRLKRIRQLRGAVIVEMAVILPILMLILMGTLEATSMIFLKQSLKIAAYEGTRVALVPNSTFQEVEETTRDILAGRRVKSFTVQVIPADYQSQPYGTPITVKTTADCAENSVFSPWFHQGKSVTSEVTMMKEWEN